MCLDHHASGSVILLIVVGVLLALFLPWWAVALFAGVSAVAVTLLVRELRATLRRRALVGPEALLGTTGVVVAKAVQGIPGWYLVRLSGELWTADSHEALEVGDRALVLDVEDGRVVVCKLPPELSASRWIAPPRDVVGPLR